MANEDLNTYGRALEAVQHDTNLLTTPCDALFVVAAGTVKLVTVGGDTITMSGSIPIGTVIPIRTRQVFNTGTTATVVAMYNPIT